jgi:hypothetical protein
MIAVWFGLILQLGWFGLGPMKGLFGYTEPLMD